MKICVVGIGGVGGYFGGLLAYAFQNKPDSSVAVYFIARGNHLEITKRKGILLKTSDWGDLQCRPFLATDDFESIGDADVFIIGVKGYDLDEVSKSLSRHVRKDTWVVPLLNGVDVRERLRSHIHSGIILPACVYVSSYIEDAGTVVQSGTPGRIILGPDPDHPRNEPDAFLHLLKEASIPCDWQQDAYPAIWEKYLFIASFGLVSARFDRTLGEIVGDDILRTLVQEIMGEIYRIAVAKKISLPPGVVDAALTKASLFPSETRTSLQRDIRQKKKNELDLFGRTIIDQGMTLGIPTPWTRKIYGEILELS
jgi:2-dehydropantoate 2-reductase